MQMLYWDSFSGLFMFYTVYERTLDFHVVYMFCCCLFVCFLVVVFYLLEEFGWFLTHIGRLPRSMFFVKIG